MNLIKSKERVANHGEVFTPSWMVEAMLDLVRDDCGKIDARFLEPACGDGNFLRPILERKLRAVDDIYGSDPFERGHFALRAIMSLYGIDIQEDNVIDCRAGLLQIFEGFLGSDQRDDYLDAAAYVLSLNIVHGDARSMKNAFGAAIHFSDWSYIGKGKFQRNDYQFGNMGLGSATTNPSLFGESPVAELLNPDVKYAAATLRDLALAWRGVAGE